MPLKIPEAGLQLDGPLEATQKFPTQAFAVTLNDDVLEAMIACVQNGDDIQLSLGALPAIRYGTKSVTLSRSLHENCDLYLSDSTDTSPSLRRLAQPAMNIFQKIRAARPMPNHATGVSTRHNGVYGAEDADVERLRESLAQAQAEQDGKSTMIVEASLGPARRGTNKNKNKPMPARSGALAQAMRQSAAPGSPYSAAGSPSLDPTLSTTEKTAAEAKSRRSHLVHELAAKGQTYKELRDRVSEMPDDQFRTTLEKVAEFNTATQTFQMRKLYWKELDPFHYKFESDAERQQAIDNAIKHFDRTRVTPGDPLWQKLLPVSERGQGKCLSKLLAASNRSPMPAAATTPKITVHDAEESSGAKSSTKHSDGPVKERKSAVAEPMSRSASSQSTKGKLSKVLGTSSTKQPGTPKSRPLTTTKQIIKSGGKEKTGKVLSKEFVSDSDSSDGEEEQRARPASKAVKPKLAEQVSKPKPKPTIIGNSTPVHSQVREKVAEKVSIKDKTSSQPPATGKIAKPLKRRRDETEEDSSSSSGQPLSKRAITGTGLKTVPAPNKPSMNGNKLNRDRVTSDASTSQSSQSISVKSKNTSPTKSSPLASSPPTNASDFDRSRPHHQRSLSQISSIPQVTVSPVPTATPTSSTTSSVDGRGISMSKKRKARDLDEDNNKHNKNSNSSSSASSDYDSRRQEQKEAKRKQQNQRLSQELVSKALRFKVFYEQYEKLHNEVVAMENPSNAKVADLLDMRERLMGMKSEIYREAAGE